MRGELPRKIRECIAASDKPMQPWQVCDKLDLPRGTKDVLNTMTRMKRDGTLVATGDPGAFAYSIGREPKPSNFKRQFTPEEILERRRTRDRLRKRGSRAKAGAKPTPSLRKEAREQRVNNPRPLPGRVFEPATAERTKRDVSADIEAFIAAGGRVEVLPGI